MKFNYEGFKLICNSTQENLRRYLYPQMEDFFGKENVTTDKEYIYCKGDAPVMLVAHMDTVHSDPPTTILYDPTQNMICSPMGIGGDDRCGVYSILSILNYSKVKPSVLFTTNEETGCIGAKKASTALKNIPANFLIELDRRGKDDAVFYETSNEEFFKYITDFGFHKETGSSSDIRYLSKEWGMASVNLSIGYLNEHTKHEIVRVNWMMDTIEKVVKIVEESSKTKFFPYKFTINTEAKKSMVLAEEKGLKKHA